MTDYVDTTFKTSLHDLAAEIGVTHAQLVETIVGNHLNAKREHGAWFVSEEVAEHIKIVYGNAAKTVVQEPKPTPSNLREDYDGPAYTAGTTLDRPRLIEQHVPYHTGNA